MERFSWLERLYSPRSSSCTRRPLQLPSDGSRPATLVVAGSRQSDTRNRADGELDIPRMPMAFSAAAWWSGWATNGQAILKRDLSNTVSWAGAPWGVRATNVLAFPDLARYESFGQGPQSVGIDACDVFFFVLLLLSQSEIPIRRIDACDSVL